MAYRYELVQEPLSCGNEVLLVQIRSQLGNKLMPAARMKSSIGDCLFFLVERDFYENFGAGLDTLSAPLNMPLSNDLIKCSWESDDTVRSQLIQGRALVEVSRNLCESCVL